MLDADGLNLLARGQVEPHWAMARSLTPHPAEAARLLGRTTAQVQADRPTAAQQLAGRYDAWIVLGAGTIVCAPDGGWRRNTSGNPGPRPPLEQAVAGAVWLHGAAADALVMNGIGPIGLTAGELADAARTLRNRG